MALQFAITASGTMVMQTSINLFGVEAISGFTAVSKVQSIQQQGHMATGMTMTNYYGQNYGAGNVSRIRKGVRTAMLICSVNSLVSAALEIKLLLYLSQLLFSGEVDIAAMLKWEYPYVYISCTCFIPLAAIFIYRNSMQGCGYSLMPTFCGVVEFTARVTTALIVMNSHSYRIAVAGDAAAWVAAEIAATVFFYVIVLKDMRKVLGESGETEET